MDLRMVKTRGAIFDAYLLLRKKHPPERIKVVDVCRLAQINKSTFYRHYRDVFQLNEELKKDVFGRFWSGYAEKGLMLTEPRRFITTLPLAVDRLGGALLSTFFRERDEDFFELLEQTLIEHYVPDDADAAESLKTKFIICGVIHVFKEQRSSRQYDNSAMADRAEKLILAVERI